MLRSWIAAIRAMSLFRKVTPRSRKPSVTRPGDRETVWDYEKNHLHPQARLPKALIDLQAGKRVKHIAIANLEAIEAYEHQQRAQEMEMQR